MVGPYRPAFTYSCSPLSAQVTTRHYIRGSYNWTLRLHVQKKMHTQKLSRRALQLHPDKNNHPKADIAFKLVLEHPKSSCLQAYSCLSDNIKRRAFNLERGKNFCINCNRIPYSFSDNLSKSYASQVVEEPSKSANRTRLLRNRIKEMKQRFKEEIKVMENCLRANSSSRKEAPLFEPSDNYLFQSNTRCVTQKESPVFDPSNHLFKGYPHIRNRIYRKPENFSDLQREDILNKYGGQGSRRSYHDFPVFELRSDRGMLKESAACVYS
ncbi:unnamed protein product [Dovyalis caffra]|uniref:J domain-containing protein n=1 Tax=Dovyalis caffra TaxID=77055 RepID=A0AAV1RDI0_9ROSI|nr:unnamed protein product [Dovyalis caffra]